MFQRRNRRKPRSLPNPWCCASNNLERQARRLATERNIPSRALPPAKRSDKLPSFSRWWCTKDRQRRVCWIYVQYILPCTEWNFETAFILIMLRNKTVQQFSSFLSETLQSCLLLPHDCTQIKAFSMTVLLVSWKRYRLDRMHARLTLVL